MAIHPIEFRYGRKDVRRIFDEEHRLQRMLDVEAALVRAYAKIGVAGAKDAQVVSSKASTKYVKVERVKEIEKAINHDVMALVKALSEQCGGSGRFIHLGATSNDITDTALALQLRDYIELFEKNLLSLKKVLLSQALKHKRTVCIGRTHGQHAIPTTYGLKFGIWASEADRHLTRLSEIKPRIIVGQMTGAVGTQAAFKGRGEKVQELVMADLGVESVLVSNQVIQRDRHAEFLLYLALVSETLNKIGTEVRNLQRTEIAEVSEGFGKKQVGSSTMPHKQNPIHAERICGLSRVIKADALAALDNIALWHERDLTNSAPERIIIPEACILTDYILTLAVDLVKNLVFHEENIKRNLELTQGRCMAESIMVELTERGLDRQEAHELVRELSMESLKRGKPFKGILLANKKIMRIIAEDELNEALNPNEYTKDAVKQVERLLRELK